MLTYIVLYDVCIVRILLDSFIQCYIIYLSRDCCYDVIDIAVQIRL